jgi:hypothetical protein
MARVFKVYATEIGGDVQTVDLYHTEILPENLIEANVTASRLTAGAGIEVQVEDSVNNFIAYNSVSGSLCYLQESQAQISVVEKGVRYFGVEGWGDGQVGSNITELTSSFSESVDYRVPGSFFTIKAQSVFPTEVVGFYYDTPPFNESNFISSGSGEPTEKYLSFQDLNSYTGSVTDTIWVKFSTGTGSMAYYYDAYYAYYNNNNY